MSDDDFAEFDLKATVEGAAADSTDSEMPYAALPRLLRYAIAARRDRPALRERLLAEIVSTEPTLIDAANAWATFDDQTGCALAAILDKKAVENDRIDFRSYSDVVRLLSAPVDAAYSIDHRRIAVAMALCQSEGCAKVDGALRAEGQRTGPCITHRRRNAMGTCQSAVRTEMGRTDDGQALNRAHRANHFLSGLIVCGECGEPFAMRDGRSYFCRNHRSTGICENDLRIDRLWAEGLVAQALHDEWATPTMARRLAEECASTRLATTTSQLSGKNRLEAELAQVNERMGRNVSAIADLGHSQSLLDKLAAPETEASRVRSAIDELEGSLPPMPNYDDVKAIYFLTFFVNGVDSYLHEPKCAAIEALQAKLRSLIDRIVVSRADDGVSLRERPPSVDG